MYCIIGQKILKCEVREKLENASIVRIGKVKKDQSVSNNRIFETEEAAQKFIKKREARQSEMDKNMSDEVAACKRAYDAFLEETGISVRMIDRLFRIGDVEKQLAHLRKKYNKSEEAKEKGAKTPKDSRQFSTKPSSSFRSSKDTTEHSFQDKGRNGRPGDKPSSKVGSKPDSKPGAKSGIKPGTKKSNKQTHKSSYRTYK